jgi:hypothetical protein
MVELDIGTVRMLGHDLLMADVGDVALLSRRTTARLVDRSLTSSRARALPGGGRHVDGGDLVPGALASGVWRRSAA